MRLLMGLVMLLLAPKAWAFDCATADETAICHHIDEQNLSECRCIGGVAIYTSPTAVPSTGTISSSGVTVTGSGTEFLSEMNAGYTIVAGGQTRTIATITDADTMTTDAAFSPALAAGTAFTITPTLGRWDQSDGTALGLLTADFRLGVGNRAPQAGIDIRGRPQPASQATGNGLNASPGLAFAVSGTKGGNTTDATGDTAGSGQGVSFFVGAGGDAPAGSTPATGASFLVIGASGGAISSGTGGTAGNGGAVSILSGGGGTAGASNTVGSGGNITLQAGAKGTGGGSGGVNGKVLAHYPSATSAGTYPLPGLSFAGTGAGAATGATNYFSVIDRQNAGATEGSFDIPVPAITVWGVSCVVSAAPGAGKSRTCTLRDDGGNSSATCTISETATTCDFTSTTGVAIAAASMVNMATVPSGTPAAADLTALIYYSIDDWVN